MTETTKPDTTDLGPDDLLTINEVAAYFRVRPRTIRDWAHDGLLPKVKLPGRVRFRWRDVQALAEEFVANRE